MTPTSSDLKNGRLRTALGIIASANNGVLNPHHVLEVARDPSHILHDQFEWDDGKAGDAYRLVQVGALIRRVKLHIMRPASATREAHITTVRAYASRSTMRHRQAGYESIDLILNDQSKRLELLATVLRELGAYRRRYAQLSELQSIWMAVDEAAIAVEIDTETSTAAPAVDASPGAAG